MLHFKSVLSIKRTQECNKFVLNILICDVIISCVYSYSVDKINLYNDKSVIENQTNSENR